jgi:hypothetical protein
MSKSDEIGLSKLSVGSVTPGQQLEAERIQRQIEWAMRGIVDYRHNPHCVSTSMLPERPTSPPAPSGDGWQDQIPLSPPPGVKECDRIADFFAAKDKAKP